MESGLKRPLKVIKSNCNAWEVAEINWVVIACVSQNLMVMMIIGDPFSMT